MVKREEGNETQRNKLCRENSWIYERRERKREKEGEEQRERESHKQYNILLNARDYSPTQYCHSPASVKCLLGIFVVLLYWYVFTTAIYPTFSLCSPALPLSLSLSYSLSLIIIIIVVRLLFLCLHWNVCVYVCMSYCSHIIAQQTNSTSTLFASLLCRMQCILLCCPFFNLFPVSLIPE